MKSFGALPRAAIRSGALALLLLVGCDRVGRSEPPASARAPQANHADHARAEPLDASPSPGPAHVAADSSIGPLADAGASEDVSQVDAEARAVAERWLDALRAGDRLALQRMTLSPFQLRDSETESGCKGGRADRPERLDQVLDCLLHRSLLRDDLANARGRRVERLDATEVPRWAQRWKRDVRAGQSVLRVDIFANGITYELVFLIEAGAVRTLWKHAEFDPD